MQGLSRAFRFPSVIDAEELCLGNYPGYVFPADIVISGGVVAKALRDSSSHFAFGFSSGGPC